MAPVVIPESGFGTIPWGSGPWGGVTIDTGLPDINGSFELGSQGAATQWLHVASASLVSLATFGTGSWVESFEDGWGSFLWEFDAEYFDFSFFNGGDTVAATIEAFESGWLNDGWVSTWPTQSTAALFDNGTDTEDMEAGWGNDAYLWEYAAGRFTEAVFDNATDTEDMEAGWYNDNWVVTYAFTEVAYFDDAPPAYQSPRHLDAEQFDAAYWPDNLADIGA